MTINKVTLMLKIKDTDHEIKGLQIVNFSLKNRYDQNHSFVHENWAVSVPEASQVSAVITLKGDYHPNNISDLIRDCAFKNIAIDAHIIFENCNIGGKFLIQEYELFSRFDEFMEFEFTLINASKIILGEKS